MTTYYQKHKEEQLKKVKEYQKTKIGKATKIMNDCKKNDRKYGRGKCDLTAEWIWRNVIPGSSYQMKGSTILNLRLQWQKHSNNKNKALRASFDSEGYKL